MPDDLSVTASQPAPPAGGDLTVTASQPPAKPGLLSSIATSVIQSPEVQGPLQGIAGFGEGALDTLQGLKTGANKLLGTSIPDVPGRTGDPNAPLDTGSMTIGKGLEVAGEWIAGEGLLSKAGELLEVTQKFPQLISLMENSPKAYAALIKAMEAGTLGAAQGAVKAPSEGKDPAKAAVYGAAGGAVLGGATELAFGATRAGMNTLFGATPQEAFNMAARPYASDVNWERSAQRGIPLLEQAARNTPFKNFGEFVDLLNETKNNVWSREIQPILDANKNEVIDTTPISTLIRSKADPAWALDPRTFQPEMDEVEGMAKNFENKRLTLEQANHLLKAYNAKLSGFYNLTSADRAAAQRLDGQITSLEAAADGLREEMFGKLTQTMTPAEATKFFEARQNYGALKDLHRIFGRRQVVYARQAPINLPQVLGAIESTAALLSGHPIAALAGAIPIATRWANSPEQLVRRGLALQRGPGATWRAIKPMLPSAAGFAGEELGRAAAPEDEGLTPEPVAAQ